MKASLCSAGSGGRRRVVLVLTVIAILAIAIATAGCSSSGSSYGSATPAAPKTASGAGTSSMGMKSGGSGTVSTASDVQKCIECDGKKMPAKVVGKAVVKDGVQVLDVGIVGGAYSPNVFTVKAGMPITVVFSGKATGCVAKPMFKSLGKKADLTTSGTATIDLGTLKPGVYKFTCAMGMNAGTITVQ